MFTITPKLTGLVAAAAVMVMAPAAIAAAPHKPVKAAQKSTKAAHKAAPKSVKAAEWHFPPCTNTAPEYEYIYSGDPCSSTALVATFPAIVLAVAFDTSVVSLGPASGQSGAFCNGNAEYEYIYSGCRF